MKKGDKIAIFIIWGYLFVILPLLIVVGFLDAESIRKISYPISLAFFIAGILDSIRLLYIPLSILTKTSLICAVGVTWLLAYYLVTSSRFDSFSVPAQLAIMCVPVFLGIFGLSRLVLKKI